MTSDGPQPCVLLVDDTPANLTALEAVLDSLGARLVRAHSGAEALDHIEHETFAVVLLDVQMPLMDGFETAKRMRQVPRGREVPILFLTAIARDEHYAKQGYAVGAADYITKPFDAQVLRARVRSYIDLFRQREDAHRVRLETRTRQRDEAQRRLEGFERIATAALENDGLDAFLHSVAAIFIGAADAADTVTILLRRGDALYARASIGMSEEVAVDFSIPLGQGFAGRIAASGRAQFLVGAAITQTVGSPWLRARGLRALYGAPLVHDGQVIGVAHMGSVGADSFTRAEMRLFQAMADRAAWAVSRHQARGRLYAVFDAAPVAMAVFGEPPYVCEFANGAYRRIHGSREPVGLPCAELGGGSAWLAAFERVFQGGETVSLDEHRMMVESPATGVGEERFFRFSLHPLRDALGKPESILIVGIDLTDEVRTRQALEDARRHAEVANRMKDEFLATVSHELRTPVSAILGWTASARGGAKDTARIIDTIERNARVQARLLDDMLDISRIVSGQLRLDIGPTDMARVLLDAVDAVRPAADAKGIELDVRLGQELGNLAVDGSRIQQVVWNLLSNAAKFTPRGGRVRLTAGRDGTSSAHANQGIAPPGRGQHQEAARFVVSVADTGEGIEETFLPHLFEPFRQGDSSTSRLHRGLGLGLAIAKQLVVAHGGSIRAQSEGRGRGAIFIVDLPIRSIPALEAAEPSGPFSRLENPADAVAVRLDGLRVLVVDDEAESLELVAQMLEGRGAHVQRSPSAQDALRAMRLFRPDVIVSDLAMPRTDGYTLIRNIRTLPPEMGGRTPAIALTARARLDDRQRAFTAGFEEHVAKPVDPADLAARVAGLGARARG